MSTWNLVRWLRLSSPTAAHRQRLPRRSAVRLLLERLEDRTVPSAFFYRVTGSADTSGLSTTGGAGTQSNPFTIGSLRSAIEQADGDGHTGTDAIDFAASVRGITLTSNTPLTLTTNMAIQNDLGVGPVTIDGNMKTNIFEINFIEGPTVTASISGLTITHGNGGSSGNNHDGGGIENYGILTVSDCTFSDNTDGTFSGGAIFVDGTLTVNDCTFSGNSAGFGGGIYAQGPLLTVSGCTFSGNTATQGGGGIYGESDQTTMVSDCTFFDNSAGGSEGGGGIENNSTMTVSDSTFSANLTASVGGGIANYSTLTLNNDIVAGNTNSTTTMPNDLSGNSVDPSSSFNLIGTGGSDGLMDGVNHNQVGVSLANVGLGPLGKYGGPTPTMALTQGSFAIGKGMTFTTPTTDQRGLDRPVNSPSDVGAFQTEAEAVFNFPVGAGNAPVGGSGTGVYQEQPGTGLQPLTAGNASALALGLVNRQATTLAIDANGDVAAEFADGFGVFRYLQASQTWTRLSTGYATALAIDDAGDVVGEFPYSNDGFEVHRWTDAAGNFDGQVAVGRASLLAGDPNGDVVGEFANGPSGGLAAGAVGTGVYEFTFTGNTVAAMTWLSSGAAVQLAMDSAGDAFGAFTNGVWEATTATHSMVAQLSAGYAPLLAADAAGDVAGYFPYGNPNPGVYEYTTAAGVFGAAPLPAPGVPTLLAMDAVGDLFGEFPGRGVYAAAAVGGGFTTQLTSPLVPATEDDASALA